MEEEPVPKRLMHVVDSGLEIIRSISGTLRRAITNVLKSPEIATKAAPDSDVFISEGIPQELIHLKSMFEIIETLIQAESNGQLAANRTVDLEVLQKVGRIMQFGESVISTTQGSTDHDGARYDYKDEYGRLWQRHFHINQTQTDRFPPSISFLHTLTEIVSDVAINTGFTVTRKGSETEIYVNHTNDTGNFQTRFKKYNDRFNIWFYRHRGYRLPHEDITNTEPIQLDLHFNSEGIILNPNY